MLPIADNVDAVVCGGATTGAGELLPSSPPPHDARVKTNNKGVLFVRIVTVDAEALRVLFLPREVPVSYFKSASNPYVGSNKTNRAMLCVAFALLDRGYGRPAVNEAKEIVDLPPVVIQLTATSE